MIYTKNPDIVLREEDAGGALLFNPDSNRIKMLNETGVFIWHLFDSTRDLTQVIRECLSNFEGVPERELETQITQFVDELVTAKLLVVVTS